MISFIIIGRNEGWKLTKCLQSVYKAIDHNYLESYEVIYVDSKSTDDSLNRVMSYKLNIKIIKLTGHCNAAIARNVGANHAAGEWFFFLDGDMEINPEWHKAFIEHTEKGRKFLTGQLIDVYYNNSWQFLTEKPSLVPSKLNIADVTNGGAFVMHKDLWKVMGGMKTEFNKSQDIDLCYRMAREGHRIFRTETIYVWHHTIQYNFGKDFFSEMKQFKKLMYRGLIMRRHFFNTAVFKRNIRINYSMLLLVTAILISILLHPLFIMVYLLVVVFRGSSNFLRFHSVIKKNIFQMIIKYFIIDIAATVGFFFFFPRKPEIQFQIIKE